MGVGQLSLTPFQCVRHRCGGQAKQDAAVLITVRQQKGVMPMSVWCRGVRGATTARENSRAAILDATRVLLQQMIAANGIHADDVASALFTTTTDLNAEFPAIAARQLGWTNVALMCGHEMNVPGSLPMCIRVLLHWNTTRTAREIIHIYTNGAEVLRPELAQPSRPVPPSSESL